MVDLEISGLNFKRTIHLKGPIPSQHLKLLKQVFSFLIIHCNNNIKLKLQNYHIQRGCMRSQPKHTTNIFF